MSGLFRRPAERKHMETIRIKGLEIFAYHGVNPEEKENGQRFVLDLAMTADLSRAAHARHLVISTET